MVMVLSVGWSLRSLLHSVDLSSEPTQKVFVQVFDVPPSPSIAAIRVAGYAAMSGEVWMRLQVNDVDAALLDLKHSKRGLIGPDKDYADSMLPPTPTFQKYMHTVGWEDVKQVKSPEYYAFPQEFGGKGWRGAIVVDRQRKLLFVEAGLF